MRSVPIRRVSSKSLRVRYLVYAPEKEKAFVANGTVSQAINGLMCLLAVRYAHAFVRLTSQGSFASLDQRPLWNRT